MTFAVFQQVTTFGSSKEAVITMDVPIAPKAEDSAGPWKWNLPGAFASLTHRDASDNQCIIEAQYPIEVDVLGDCIHLEKGDTCPLVCAEEPVTFKINGIPFSISPSM